MGLSSRQIRSALGIGGALVCAIAGGELLAQEPTASESTAGPGVSTSRRCAICHSSSDGAEAMRDSKERSIAPHDLWRSTMMAQSARDPLFRAVLSVERAATPAADGDIARTCLRCHAPLADRVGLDDHGTGEVTHALECDGELGELARDGASCTICHGIHPEGLGTDATFDGHFALNSEGLLFGPHDEVFEGPMQNVAGFTPRYGAHVTQSKLCATCHTQSTHTIDPEGAATGHVFHEQTPYLEWRNSAFTNEDPDGALLDDAEGARTCQDCHLPTTDASGRRIRSRLARNPGGFDFPFLEKRAPVGRHLLVGGNAFMLEMMRDHRDALGIEAPVEAFDATIEATRDQLANRTAHVTIAPADAAQGGESQDGASPFEVTVTNLTGHKLPTGHPSRRVWVELVARDAAGAIVFASGRPNEDGQIVDGTGAVLPTELADGPIEPHRNTVRSASEVARYRSVMADPKGEPTFLLTRAASWYVDDRLLPRGWRSDHPDAARTQPRGVDGDSDFAPAGAAGGRDRVLYVIPAEADQIEVRFLYQALSPRYLAELASHPTPALERFLEMAEGAGSGVEVLARARWQRRP